MARKKSKVKSRKNEKCKSKVKLPESLAVSTIELVVARDAWYCLGRLQSIVDRETDLLLQGVACRSDNDLQESRAILVEARQFVRSQPETAQELLSRGLMLWQS